MSSSSNSRFGAGSCSLLLNNSIYILFKSTFTMKNIVSLMMALCCSLGLGLAQLSPLSSTGYSTEAPVGYWLELETVISHSGGELDSMTTYRLYMNMQNEMDYLSACSGDSNNPLMLHSSSGEWYNNSANSGWNAQGITPMFVGFVPELAYDSFLTIGAQDGLAPASQQPSTIWGGIDASAEFDGNGPGMNVTVNDSTGGAWYIPFPGLAAYDEGHVAFAGSSGDGQLRVLVAQFTTKGTITGQIWVQVFQNGDQGQEFRDLLPICAAGDCGGCTDESADNYDPEALYDDESCQYGTPGCNDDAACNFDEAATYDDGSCEYAPENFDCEGNCIAGEDCNGECGGTAVLDECGVCGGSGIAEGDCDCDGNVEDALGVCGGDCAADADADGICDDVDDCVGTLDACGVCNGPGAIYECGCADIAEGDCDCDGNQLDALGVCGGDCAEDADADGICDDVDDCVGALDACGVCNGPGEIYECGCEDIAEGDCDCDGNQLDALGVCGGDCAADADADGICDDVDDCVGVLDACGVCNGPGEIYECGCEDIAEGDCDCDGNQDDALGVCGGDCAADADADGICDDVDECIGTLDACGICNGPGAIYDCGCEDIADGDCDCDGNQEDALGECGGDCAADADSDGICDDEDDCVGALDACGICNGPGAIYECGCSDIAEGDCDCSGNQEDAIGNCGGSCEADEDGDGICDSADDCVGEFDDCGVCNGDGASCYCEVDDDNDGICDEEDDCVGSYDDCGVCNGTSFCTLDASGFEGLSLTASSSCGEDALAPGLDDSFELVLQAGGNLAASTDAGSVIVGSWGIDECDCQAELSFFALECDGVAFELDAFGIATQLSAEEDCCISISNPVDTWCSTEFFDGLEDETVPCAEDLPTGCDPTIMALDTCATSLVICNYNSAADAGYVTHEVTTAMGPGPDGAIRIYGLSAQTVCATDYFVEGDEPLVLTRFESTGTAVLTGEVFNDTDPSISFDVEMYFNMEENAAEWMADTPGAGLLTAWDCDVDPEALTVYTLRNTISKLVGTGSMTGELYLSHMPVSENKRFQLGDGGNNHNCEYGFGGWFGWQGVLNGNSVMGFSGDVIADLGDPILFDTDCGGEFVELTYAMINVAQGQSQFVTQTWSVNDTEAPEFHNAPESYIVEWSDLHDGDCNWSIEVPCLTTTDNCAQWDPIYEGCNEPADPCGTVEFTESIQLGDCEGNFVIFRGWTATDGSGNSRVHSQTIQVRDTQGPDFSGTPYETTISCSDLNVMDYEANDCSGVTEVWFEQSLQSGTCSNPGSLSRTYYATDACGNLSSFEQIVNIEDDEAPVILASEHFVDCSDYSSEDLYPLMIQDCALRIWSVDEDGVWSSTYNTNWSTEYDDIDSPVEVSWVDGPAVAGDGSCYVITRTVTATDNCGNSSTLEYPINITDTTDPEIWASNILEIEFDTYVGNDGMMVMADQIGQILGGDQAQFSVNDDCSFVWSGMVSVEWTDAPSEETTCLDVPGGSVFDRTYTVTDACGNSATAEQQIVLIDTQAPVWANPSETLDPLPCEEATLELMNNPEYMLNAGGVFDSGDADLDIQVNAILMSGGCIGVWYRQWVAIDDCGNMSYADQYVSMYDNVAPEFTSIPADLTISLDGSCAANQAIEATGGYPTVSDNCDLCLDQDLEITSSESDQIWLCEEGIGSYQIERTWSVTDHCGNTAEHVQVLTFEDDSDPVWNETLPADMEVSCEEPEAVVLTASDNCDDTLEVAFTEEISDQTCPNRYTVTRTWSTADACGNAISHTQIITVGDDEAPVGYASMPDVSCADYNENPDQIFGEVSATDNCGGEVTIEFDVNEDEIITLNEDGSVKTDGCVQVERIYTFTDVCGNTSQLMQTINIIDDVAPSYVGPMEVTIPAHEYDVEGLYPPDECWELIDGTGDVPVWYVDDCSGLDTCLVMDLPLSGGCANQPHPNFFGETAAYLRVLTIIDNCGNMSMAEIIITLEDDLDPMFDHVPADYEVSCASEVTYEEPVVSDLTDENVVVELVEEVIPGDCPNSYTLIRTWTATDNCDNEATASQTVTVNDETAPELTIPADYTAECSDEHPLDDASATDNCGDVSITLVADTAFGACAGDYVVTRTFTATDACGNATTAAQTITIEDTTAPEFTYVPADYTAECSDEHPLEAAMASDNCGNVTIEMTADTTAGSCVSNYTVVRTFVATDDCGHSTTASQTITIQDTTAPALEDASDLTVECDGAGNEAALAEWLASHGGATAEDNCNTISWSNDFDSLTVGCAATGSATVTFTVMDECGNSDSTTATFTIQDTTAPAIEGLTDIDVSCDLYSEEDAYASASDQCGEFTLTWEDSPISGGCAIPVGTYRREYTATDECGNVSTMEQYISLIDSIAPEFTLVPADYTAECDEVLVFDAAEATDNCSGATITEQRDTIAGDCPQSFTIVRTFTAADNCDNATVAQQTITVQDTTAPELTIPEDYTAECSDEHPLGDAYAYDNCGEVTLELVTDTLAGDCAQSYVVTRQFTATDECGNASTATQTITIQDTTAPAFVEGLPADATVECDAIPAADTLTATDNCQDVNVIFTESTEEGECANAYTITRLWTVSDDCGNTTSHTQVLTVEDTTAPELTIPADYTAECSDEHPLDDASATDNCGDVTIDLVADTTWTCANTYEVTRTFTATDACGNATTAAQVITIQDTQAPAFNEALPADDTVECDSVPEAAVLSATDNCSDVSVMFEEIIEDGECPQTYTITRVWSVEDECGNATSHTQVIEVEDTTAPTFLNVGGLMNGETVSVSYDDNYGSVTLPGLVSPTAMDNCQEPESCDSAATAEANAMLMDVLGLEEGLAYLVEVNATGINNPFLTGGETTSGTIATPEVMPDGQTCDNNPVAHGVRMFNFLGGEYYTTDEGTATLNADGSVHVSMTATMVNDTLATLTVDANFESLMTWEEWLDTPGLESYKSDCGLGDHTEWMYTTLTSGTITGGGSLAGTSLMLTHQPMNKYFGFQFGEGANNKNENFGFSGWFYYSGQLQMNGETPMTVMGSGDLFGDLDFMQDWSTTLTYCIEDCAENSSEFSYTIASSGSLMDPLDEGGIQEGEDSGLVTPKELIQIVTLHPNPTNGQTMLVLESEQDVVATVAMYDMSGGLVDMIYQGQIVANWSTTLNIDAQGLESGMYQIRINAKEFVTTKKLLVIE